MIHLISDNGVAAFSKAKNHLGGVEKTESHLAIVQLAENWTNKTMIVVPSEIKWAGGYALGVESYRYESGTVNVQNDTRSLVTSANAVLDEAEWCDGPSAVFMYACRSYEPVAHNRQSTLSSDEEYSGYGLSCVAYKFDTKRLPLSKMTSFTVKIRLYQPTFLATNPPQSVTITNPSGGTILVTEQDEHNATVLSTYSAHGGNCVAMMFRFSKELDSTVGSWSSNRVLMHPSLSGFNDQTIQTSAIEHVGCCAMYDTDDDSIWPGPMQKIWCGGDGKYKANDRTVTHVDLTFSQSASHVYDFMRQNPGEFWVQVRPSSYNPFSSSSDGINPACGVFLYFQRAELVITCSGNAFNNE